MDPDLIPWSQQPAGLLKAQAAGLKLPPDAVVTAPDGRKFFNKLIVDRLRPTRTD